MVLALGLGSHDQELAEETAEVPEAREVVRVGVVGVAFELVGWAEEGLVAVEGARVGRCEGGLGGGMSHRGGDLRTRAAIAVAEVGVGVGAEEREDEE